MKKAAALILMISCIMIFWACPIIAQNNLEYVGSYDSLAMARAIVVSHGYAYVADAAMGLVIMAVSDSTAPAFVSMYNTYEYGFDIDVKDNFAYLATGYSEPYMGVLYVIDITDRQNPVRLGTYTTPWEITSIEADSFVYLTTYGSGVSIIDVSNPWNPTLISNFLQSVSVADMQKHGNYLYVAGYRGLYIADVSDPQYPALVGECNTPGRALSVAIRPGRDNSEKYAYVAADTSGLQIIDISSPTAPFIVSNYRTTGAVKNVIGGQFYIYATVGDSAVEVIEVGLPTRLRRVGWANESPMAKAVGLERNLVAVVGGESIDIFRAGNGACQYVIGDINGNGFVNGIDVAYGVAYFKGSIPPPAYCPCPPHGDMLVAGDVNGTCTVNGLDIMFLVKHLEGHYSELLPCPDCPPGY